MQSAPVPRTAARHSLYEAYMHWVPLSSEKEQYFARAAWLGVESTNVPAENAISIAMNINLRI
jgi:hypothetical protein